MPNRLGRTIPISMRPIRFGPPLQGRPLGAPVANLRHLVFLRIRNFNAPTLFKRVRDINKVAVFTTERFLIPIERATQNYSVYGGCRKSRFERRDFAPRRIWRARILDAPTFGV